MKKDGIGDKSPRWNLPARSPRGQVQQKASPALRRNKTGMGLQRGSNRHKAYDRLKFMRRRKGEFHSLLKTMTLGEDSRALNVGRLIGYFVRNEFGPQEQRLMEVSESIKDKIVPVCRLFDADTRALLLQDQPVSEDEPALLALKQCIGLIVDISSMAEERQVLKQLCGRLEEDYQQALTLLTQGELAERQALLTPKVTMVGLRGKVYIVEAKLARNQLCRDLKSRIQRLNEAGSHPVSCVRLGDKKFWGKPNPVDDGMGVEPLDEQASAQMSNLYGILSKEKISVLTHYLKYRDIPVLEADPTISTHEGTIERMVQVSEDAQGFPFYLVLHLIRTFKHFNAFFGEYFPEMLDMWRVPLNWQEELGHISVDMQMIYKQLALIKKVQWELEYASDEKLYDLVQRCSDFDPSDLDTVSYFPELAELGIELFARSLEGQLAQVALPVLQNLLGQFEEDDRPEYAAELMGEDQNRAIRKLALMITHPSKFLSLMVVCRYTPELLTYPDMDLRKLLELPDLMQACQWLYPTESAEDILQALPHLLEKHLHWPAVTTMVVHHLISLINDANFDNLFLCKIPSSDGESFRLMPKDIDMDKWWGNQLFDLGRRRKVQQDDGTFKWVVDEHCHKVGLKSQLLTIPEIMDHAIDSEAINTLTAQRAIFYISDWLALCHERDKDCRLSVERDYFTESDLVDGEHAALSLFFAVSDDVIPAMLRTLSEVQTLIKEPGMTHRKLLQALYPMPAAMYEATFAVVYDFKAKKERLETLLKRSEVSLGVLLRAVYPMLPELYQDKMGVVYQEKDCQVILARLEVISENPALTHHEFISALFPEPEFALHLVTEEFTNDPIDALKLLYEKSIQDLVTRHDNAHPFTSQLRAYDRFREEMNLSERTQTLPEVVGNLLQFYPIDQLTDQDAVGLIDQLGRTFDFVKDIPYFGEWRVRYETQQHRVKELEAKLKELQIEKANDHRLFEDQRREQRLAEVKEQLSEAQQARYEAHQAWLPKQAILNRYLHQAASRSLPGATKLLLATGADVNHYDYAQRMDPVLCELLKNYATYDFRKRFWKTFDAILAAPGMDPSLPDRDGNTPVMVFARVVDPGHCLMWAAAPKGYAFIAGDILHQLQLAGADMVAVNKAGQHAFDICYQRGDDIYYTICMTFIEAFLAGHQFNIDHLDSFLAFLHQYYNKDISEYDYARLHDLLVVHHKVAYRYAADLLLKDSPDDVPEGHLCVKVEGAFSGVKYLSIADHKEPINNHGRVIKKGLSGLSCAAPCRIEGSLLGLFLKEEPESFGVQQAMERFRDKLAGFGTTHSEAFKFTDKHGQIFPVSMASMVLGSVPRLAHTGKFDYCANFVPYNFAGMFASAVICKNKDGNLGNYGLLVFMRRRQREALMVGLDDEQFFQTMGVGKNSKGRSELWMKDWVLCLDQMQEPLDPIFVKRFCALDIQQFLTTWLDECDVINAANQKLFDGRTVLYGNRDKGLKKLVKNKRQTVIPVLFSKAQIQSIHRSFTQLQALLKERPKMIAIELLRRIEPKVGAIISGAFRQCDTPARRFNHIASNGASLLLRSEFGTVISQRILESKLMSADKPTDERKCTPLEAKEFLMESEGVESVIKVLLEQVKRGGFVALLQETNIEIRNQVFERLCFKDMDARVQEEFIQFLVNNELGLTRLTLRHCHFAVEKDYKAIIENCGDDLDVINLSGSSQVTEGLMKFINKSNATEALAELNISGTDVTSLTFTNLEHLRVLRATDCAELTMMHISNKALRYLLVNNSALTELSFSSRKLHTIDVRGCHLAPSSWAGIMLSAELQKVKMDAEPPNFNRRFLILHCVNQHMWSPRMVQLIVRQDGYLDLAGFDNLTDADLIEIAKHSQIKEIDGVPMPKITHLDLRNSKLPRVGLMAFLGQVPSCEKISVLGDYVPLDTLGDEGIFGIQGHCRGFTAYKTGEVAALSKQTQYYNPLTSDELAVATSTEFYAMEDQKYSLQLPDGYLLVCSNASISMSNPISGTTRIVGKIKSARHDTVRMEYLSGSEILIINHSARRGTVSLFHFNCLTEQLKSFNAALKTVDTAYYVCVHDAQTLAVLHDGHKLSFVHPHTGYVYETVMSLPKGYGVDAKPLKMVSDGNYRIALMHPTSLSIYNTKTRRHEMVGDHADQLGENQLVDLTFVKPDCVVYVGNTNSIFVYDCHKKGRSYTIEFDVDDHRYIGASTDVWGNFVLTRTLKDKTRFMVDRVTGHTYSLKPLHHVFGYCAMVALGHHLAIAPKAYCQDFSEANKAIQEAALLLESLFPNNVELKKTAYGEFFMWLKPSVGLTTDELAGAFYAFCNEPRPLRSHQSDCVDLQALTFSKWQLQQFIAGSQGLVALHNLPQEYLSLPLLLALLRNNPALQRLSITTYTPVCSSESISPRSSLESGNEEEVTLVPKEAMDVDLTFRADLTSVTVVELGRRILSVRFGGVDRDSVQSICRAVQHFLPDCRVTVTSDSRLRVENIDEKERSATAALFKSLMVQAAKSNIDQEALMAVNARMLTKLSVFQQRHISSPDHKQTSGPIVKL